MMNRERYGTRDLTYSRWHREQGNHLTYVDIDSVEYCRMCKQPLALIETGQDVGQSYKCMTVTRNLARMSHLPAYLVLYQKDESGKIVSFRRWQTEPHDEVSDEVVLTPEQYRNFLCELRRDHLCYQWYDIYSGTPLPKAA